MQEAEARGVQLWDLDDDVLVGISPELDPSVREVLSVQGALSGRTTVGGTSPASVRAQIERLDQEINSNRVTHRSVAEVSLRKRQRLAPAAPNRARVLT